MHTTTRQTAPRRFHLRPGLHAALLVLALLASGLTATAEPAAAFGRAIEGYAGYQGQTSCSPSAKTGTLKLSTYLQRTYPGTGSLGIVRSCGVGGRSEHKEGRAFDWRVNARNKRQKAQADAFVTSLLATDQYGNRHALARRMGLMYVIWNKRIWSTTYATSGWRRYSGPSAHTDHVHISLNWNGARGRTSWYTGRTLAVPAPKPKPLPKAKPLPKPKPAPKPVSPPILDPNRSPATALKVPASGRVLRTAFSLRAGTTYRLVATGTYRYGRANSVADAHCSWDPHVDGGWQDRSTWERTAGTHLELLVNGTGGWRARSGGTCDREQAYVRDIQPTRTGPVDLQIRDDVVTDNSGSLTVTILPAGKDARAVVAVPAAAPVAEPAADADPDTDTDTDGPAALEDTVTVPAADPRGALTTQVLQEDVTYRITVSGSFDYGEGSADAECSRARNSSTWRRERSVDPFHPDLDSLDLYVDGRDLWADPVRDTGDRCDAAGNTYRWTYTPTRTGRARFAVWDPSPQDNRGSLSVTVSRTSSVRTPQSDRSLPTSGDSLWDETVELSTASPDGAVTSGILRSGRRYAVIVSGTWQTGYGEADAECSALRPDGLWRRNSSVQPARPRDDLFDLYVDGRDADLDALDDDGEGCSTTHRYVGTLRPYRTGAVRLALWDVATADNSGSLTVRLIRTN